MSSRAKNLARNIKNTLRFDASMYCNTFGSYVIASYLLNETVDKKREGEINRLWRKVEKNPGKYIDLSDENWLENLAKLFGVEYDLTGRIALCEGQLNNIFCIVDNDGHVYPLREDGWIPKTLVDALKTKKIFRVVEDTTSESPVEEFTIV